MAGKRQAILLLILLTAGFQLAQAQLKFIVEDFEGFATGQENFADGIYAYGSATAVADKSYTTGKGYSGNRCIKVGWTSSRSFGGWGKGVGLNIQLDPNTDNLNFYVYSPSGTNKPTDLVLTLADDDNMNGTFDQGADDEWMYELPVQPKNEWQLVSVPLNKFKDNNQGGDGIFNITYKDGELLTFAVNFTYGKMVTPPGSALWYFDFICFSKGVLPTGEQVLEPAAAKQGDFCLLGAWSDVGYDADFTLISNNFAYRLKSNEKRLGVIHFFLPLASDGSSSPNTYPNVARLNDLISQKYTPMITMELQYVQVGKHIQQPNLYTVIEGHLDEYFKRWAKTVKQVNGIVLVRLMHEFNGDWYPWCIATNDRRPELYIKAYQHIHDIFKSQDASNVRFIWCPNSRPAQQASWNYIIDAYPGDEYVDYLGLDVYNGAHGGDLWRSFRREIIENYFLFNEYIPNKPILVCETASRERTNSEKGELQAKSEWIMQMSEALKTDISRVRLVNWFDQYKMFKVNSSNDSRDAFISHIWKDAYFVPNSQWYFK